MAEALKTYVARIAEDANMEKLTVAIEDVIGRRIVDSDVGNGTATFKATEEDVEAIRDLPGVDSADKVEDIDDDDEDEVEEWEVGSNESFAVIR